MYATFSVTRDTANQFIRLFVNRLAFGIQATKPQANGRLPYFRQKRGLDSDVVRMHLNGDVTINLYAINPETQRSKWVAIDADFDGAVEALLQLQWELRQDGVEAALEQSRRGAHLWIFAETPLLAAECRIYIYNLALKLGVPVLGGGLKQGIEVFPKQDHLKDGEFGNAIRAPLGVHRKTKRRYWFYDAELTPEAQIDYLNSVKKLTEQQLKTFIKGMSLPAAYRPPAPAPYRAPSFPSERKEFRILEFVQINQRVRDPRNYVAQCPSCAQDGHDRGCDNLKIKKTEPQKYRCWRGCSKEDIRAALGQPIRTRQLA